MLILNLLCVHIFIPPEIVEGLYDDFFEPFLQERSESIYKLILNTTSDLSDEIKAEYYEKKTLPKSGSIKVFGTYLEARYG